MRRLILILCLCLIAGSVFATVDVMEFPTGVSVTVATTSDITAVGDLTYLRLDCSNDPLTGDLNFSGAYGVFFRDGNSFVYSGDVGYLTLVATVNVGLTTPSVQIGRNVAEDLTINFNSLTNDGSLTWKDTEGHFLFEGGNVVLFGENDVDNAVDGRSLYVYRKAAEEDSEIRAYIDADHWAHLVADENFSLHTTNDNLFVYAEGGFLELQYTAYAPIECFSGADVGDDEDGQSLYIHRKAVEGDSYLQFYIDADQDAYIVNTAGDLIFDNTGGSDQISFLGSDLSGIGTITASTITDGAFSTTSGALTGIVSLDGSGTINLEDNLDGTGFTITGGTLTDGTAVLTDGNLAIGDGGYVGSTTAPNALSISSVGDATFIGQVLADNFSDGVLTIVNGAITSLVSIAGDDLDISAGTGDISTTGTLGAGAITGTSFHLLDNNAYYAGTSDDLKIYHDGSDNYISVIGIGELKLTTKNETVAGTAADDIRITAGNGGQESYPTAGGVGGDVRITSGNGGTASVAGVNAGGIYLTTGAGSNANASGGVGGAFRVLGGQGGSAGGIAGRGGTITMTSGKGNTAGGAGSTGGDFYLTSGEGGDGRNGAGGAFYLTSGAGGDFSDDYGNAGNGGNFVLAAGAGGAGTGDTASEGGDGGNAYFNPGAKGTGTTDGSDGIVGICVNPSTGVAFGKLGIGTKTPTNLVSLPLDNWIDFGDNAVKIGSDDNGHLDLTADVSIDLNTPLTITTGDISIDSDTSGFIVGDGQNASITWDNANSHVLVTGNLRASIDLYIGNYEASDAALVFTGATNSGQITWIEADDYFRVDDLMKATFLTAGLSQGDIQEVSDDATLTVGTSYIRVVGHLGAVTLDSDPAIADGTTGQLIMIEGTSDANTVTIANNCNTQLNGDAAVTLGLNDTIQLIFNGTDWIEVPHR